MKKLVLFDIDHTLFDATLYRSLMFDLISEYISLENKEKLFHTLESVYFSHRKKIGYFDLEFMLEELKNELNIELDTLAVFNTILQDEESYQKALFKETVSVLERLAADKQIQIGIFSGGRKDHQLRKIASFQHVF